MSNLCYRYCVLHNWIKLLQKVSFYFIISACLHRGGGPQVGEVTHLGGVTRLSI